ncbi:D-2-hydroxyacid dehydrogenase [Achromobacter insolitus]|uniref:Glyoxylate/hydroxypyruvate reductase B n=1 Tax=Achromobacter insolitus TaxID=217204 RepID=A0A6S7F336_9BURK|nr:D-2-hydroxyacid dehydrogenase [Achromobacter insolitus]CAB3933735.1 Glyoxylate/hydroxypyruvate reductase B [Achromobacter insolitus]CAB3937579.1 Glyoxylate/hydroxypyruvate reductase B [Achromobacter insolitus]
MTRSPDTSILCSPAEAPSLRLALDRTPAAGRYALIHPVAGQPMTAETAFISRDVTGHSTKFEIQESTALYYEAMRHAPALRWVHVHSAGADREIYQALHARGVAVTTSQGASDLVVAQSAIAGLLALARSLPAMASDQRVHAWRPLLDARMPRDLAGQHAVIVGWGGIGQRIGALLGALGLDISVARHSGAPVPQARHTVDYGALASLLPAADWLVLACPLTPATRNLIDRDALAALPAHAMVVNVARGHVIDEPELIAALRAGRVGGAFLDVFQHEPLPPESPLWDLPNVIVTPHSAGFSDGNAARVRGLFVDNLNRWLAGAPLANRSLA